MQSTGFQLTDLKNRLENHKAKKGTLMAPDNFKWKKTLFELEEEYHLLRCKSLDERITELAAAKFALQREWEKLAKGRK
jgi:hypothetical protein